MSIWNKSFCTLSHTFEERILWFSKIINCNFLKIRSASTRVSFTRKRSAWSPPWEFSEILFTKSPKEFKKDCGSQSHVTWGFGVASENFSMAIEMPEKSSLENFSRGCILRVAWELRQRNAAGKLCVCVFRTGYVYMCARSKGQSSLATRESLENLNFNRLPRLVDPRHQHWLPNFSRWILEQYLRIPPKRIKQKKIYHQLF